MNKHYPLVLALLLAACSTTSPHNETAAENYGGYSGVGGMTAYAIPANVYAYHYDHGFTGIDAMGWAPELQYAWSRFGAAAACNIPYDKKTALTTLQKHYGEDKFAHELNGIDFHRNHAAADAQFCTPERLAEIKRVLPNLLITGKP